MCLTNLVLRHEDEWRSRYTDPGFLDLGTAIPQAKVSRYTLERGLVDPRAGPYDVKEGKLLILPVVELRPLGRPLLYRLRYPG
jgi:hypothetical protein